MWPWLIHGSQFRVDFKSIPKLHVSSETLLKSIPCYSLRTTPINIFSGWRKRGHAKSRTIHYSTRAQAKSLEMSGLFRKLLINKLAPSADSKKSKPVAKPAAKSKKQMFKCVRRHPSQKMKRTMSSTTSRLLLLIIFWLRIVVNDCVDVLTHRIRRILGFIYHNEIVVLCEELLE